MALLSACAVYKPGQPGIGQPVGWDSIPGWHDDNHAEAWPALQHNCQALAKQPVWDEICRQADRINQPDHNQARRFFQTWFVPHKLYAAGGREHGLITGYYEPLLFGSTVPDERYRFPIYRRPENLLTVDLSSLYPELKNKRLRGRRVGNKIIPFFSRAEIESDDDLLAGQELLWLDDRDAVFFLHIQGSGRVQLEDGQTVGVGYSDQNGHPYVSIGRILMEQGHLKPEEISLFTLRQWLRDNPDKAGNLLNANPSYVFFVLRELIGAGPTGSMNVPLTTERSIAIDPELVRLGTPIWLATNYPGQPGRNYARLVFAQDTGGAIKGALRADLFWGHGEYAEQSAGIMQEKGRLIVLLPRSKAAGL